MRTLWPRARSARTIALAALGVVAMGLSALPASAKSSASWEMGGQSFTNWRFQPHESSLNQGTVKKAKLLWVANMAGDVSATPAVSGQMVYVPDFGGKFTKLDA